MAALIISGVLEWEDIHKHLEWGTALFIFGGRIIRGFSFALMVGIVVGTYSSIFVASPVLVFWESLARSSKPEGSKQAKAA